MNHKQKQIAEQFWKDYFYMTTDTPDKDTFIAFCENLADESRLLDAPVMQKIADLRNKLSPFINLAQMTPLVLGEASNKDYMKAYTVIRKESENIQQNNLIEIVRKLLAEIESNFSA